eukprot:1178327-Prorocentrum_minimum.AAC.3
MVVEADIADVDPELLLQLMTGAVTPGIATKVPEFTGHRIEEGFPTMNIAVGGTREHAQLTGQASSTAANVRTWGRRCTSLPTT